MKKELLKKITIFTFLISCFTGYAQSRIYVNGANISGTYDGTSWVTAYNDFQAGVNAASAGDTIFVAQGTYQPASGNSFSMKEGVKIYGGFAGTETGLSQRNWKTNVTTLKGNNNIVIDNTSNNLTVAAVLDGFTVTGGQAIGANGPNGSVGSAGGTGGDGVGAGMYNSNSSPTVSNVIFSNNAAYGGNGGTGGAGSIGGASGGSGGSGGNGMGAGMYNDNYSSPVLTNVTFSNNSVYGGDGGTGGLGSTGVASASSGVPGGMGGYGGAGGTGGSGYGAGMYNNGYSSPVLTDVVFSSNPDDGGVGGAGGIGGTGGDGGTTGDGGSGGTGGNGGTAGNGYGNGIYNNNYSSATLINVVFSSNSANGGMGGIGGIGGTGGSTSGATYYGGNGGDGGIGGTGGNIYGVGIYNDNNSSCRLTNATFSNNSGISGSSGNGGNGGAGGSGTGGSGTAGAPGSAGATGNSFGGAIYNNSSATLSVGNTIFWGNTAIFGADVYNSSGIMAVTYSYTQTAISGTGNVESSTDPFLNSGNAIGADGVWMTADDGLHLDPTNGASAIDAGSNDSVPASTIADITGLSARIQNTTVDMGAYENGCVTVSSPVVEACDNYTSPSGKYTWTASGSYIDTIPNNATCDSIMHINLTIHNSNNGDTLAYVCDSIVWYGTTYNSDGRYSHVLKNMYGCDSTVTLHLTLYSNTGDTTASACGNFTWYGNNYTASGTPTFVLTNRHGCDSTVTLHLTINQPTTSTPSISGCDSVVSPSGKYTWKASGTFNDTIANQAGCDSVMTISVMVSNSTTASISPSGCDSVVVNGTAYKATGTFTQKLTNKAGCDSTLTINATVNPLPTVNVTGKDTIAQGSTDTLTASGGVSYAWSNSSSTDTTMVSPGSKTTYTVTVTDGNGCSDTASFTVYVDITTSIASTSASTLTLTLTSVYPNPVINTLNLSFRINANTEGKIEVCDESGRVLSSSTEALSNGKVVHINVANLAQGMYFVKVVAEKQTQVIKFIKE